MWFLYDVPGAVLLQRKFAERRIEGQKSCYATIGRQSRNRTEQDGTGLKESLEVQSDLWEVTAEMDVYRIIGHISAGAHGVILKGIYASDESVKHTREEAKKRMLAIKRVFVRKQKEMPISLLREIKSLQLLNGENYVIPLLDVFAHGSSVNMVFPLLPVNLTALIYEQELTSYHKSIYSYMLMEGVNYCHFNGIIHRDLKPSNLLIDWDGILKICDFGQARALPPTTGEAKGDNRQEQEDNLMSHQVCTRWYRAPELLYGSNNYDMAVDLWSVGCIIGEMLQEMPLFRADSDIEQLCLVITTLGDPPFWWVKEMPDYNKIVFNTNHSENGENGNDWVKRLAQKGDADGVDLVVNLCKYTDRLTAKECLDHPFLREIKEKGYQKSLLIRPQSIKQMVGPPHLESKSRFSSSAYH